jgi:hypothetical protein
MKDAGEIACVLLAVEMAPALVILDDHRGKRLAKHKQEAGANIGRISSVQLAAEMVDVGVLSRDEGLTVFWSVLEGRTDVTDAQFDQAIRQAR